MQNTNKQNINLEHWILYTEMDAGLTNKLKNKSLKIVLDPEHSSVTNYGQNINKYRGNNLHFVSALQSTL